MLKSSHFLGQTEQGPSAIPLFGKADAFFEKTASVDLLPEVVKYIAVLKPRNDSQYVLVNAMGASEYYGSNINGDAFPEASLIHKPDEWTGNPILDSVRGREWSYGFPTFYRAHPYGHHRNKDSSRAFGEVELAAWNPDMKRVELVTRVDRDRCVQYGGQGVWDKLRSGDYPDVSMGSKVPYDTCSICLDRALYDEARAQFEPVRHKHPGMAALEFHKARKLLDGKGIRGLSITRNDYCQHALKMMNRILPDGRKVFVDNDYPSFFDISFVFIGADKTAKTMLFIFSSSVPHATIRPSADIAAQLGTRDPDEGAVKTSSVHDEILKQAFGSKLARLKEGEISKEVIPSQFAGKAVPLLTGCEEDLPDSDMDRMSAMPPEHLLSTLGGMGVLLRPREFQRIILLQLGRRDLADDLDSHGEVFEKSDDHESMGVEPRNFLPALAEVLAPLFAKRSFLAPELEHRASLLPTDVKTKSARAPSHSRELLDKIAAAYNGYRRDVMELAAHSQHLLALTVDGSFRKLSAAPMHEIFSPLSAAYLKFAYADEFGVSSPSQTGFGRRGGGSPSEEHVDRH
jgi:hypothetical protein